MTTTTIETILSKRYEVGVLFAPVEAVIWAADLAVEKIGAEAARKELSKVNRKREKFGRMPVYPAYGTVLFGDRKGVN